MKGLKDEQLKKKFIFSYRRRHEMRFQKKYAKYLTFLLLTFLLLLPFLSSGRGFRLDLLPDKGKNFGCATCHVNAGGGGARNSFGKDWEKIAIPQGDKYVPDIAEKDSDGDGFTNDEEFEAETHPGDPKSHPEPPKDKPVRPKGKMLTTWGKIKADVLR